MVALTVQGATWSAQPYSLNLNFSFLNRISLLLVSNSYSFVLKRLGGPLFRPKIGIKIPDPAGNRIRAAGMDDSDSADYAMATDLCKHFNFFILAFLSCYHLSCDESHTISCIVCDKYKHLIFVGLCCLLKIKWWYFIWRT